MATEFQSLIELFDAIPDEAAAIAYFKAIRWKDGERCPYCGHNKVYGFKDGKTWKCAAPNCRQRFSIRVGTIFEDSKIPLRKWLAAIWFITSHRKGIASTQLARDLKVTQKTAWFMLHRLRHAARTRSFVNRRPLTGEIEADETFIGGKDRNKPKHKRSGRKQGDKVVVFGLRERGGEIRARPISGLKDVKAEIIANVEKGATLYTDDWSGYQGVDHHVTRHSVDHSKDEYVRHYIIHTNGIESVWALLKRQIIGIHHWVSAKHLHRYIDEVTFRLNRSVVTETQRMQEFCGRVDGRLTYDSLTAKPTH